MSKKYALIVAGGSGSRMQNKLPKQFLPLDGKPVLMHTFEAFLNYDAEIVFVLVLPKNQILRWKNLCVENGFNIPHQIVAGGTVRFESVRNGLQQIADEGIVFIHDGVRPLVSEDTLKRCYQTASEKGNALPVVPVSESVRLVESDGSNKAVDRSKYFLVQTPQTFQSALIKNAYSTPFYERFTDDASVLESTGTDIFTVDGNRENIKITFPDDLLLAELLLRKTNQPSSNS